MKILSHADMTAVLEGIQILHSDLDKDTLPSRVFRAVSKCVEADITAFDGFGSDTTYSGRIWYDPMDSVTDKELEAFAAHTTEHPFFIEMLVDKKSDVLKISDYLSKTQFHRTGIFNEFYRKVGVRAQMAVALNISPELLVTCALSRSRTDFTERDRALLTTLSPHLINAFKNSHAFDWLRVERDYLSRNGSRGLAILDREGKLVYLSELGAKLLEKYFDDFQSGALPSKLRSYVDEQNQSVRSGEFYGPATVLLIDKEESRLSVRIAFDFTAGEARLILEEHRPNKPPDFEKLGLTEREAEILFWIAEGKTDSSIALLCDISPRTVQKHTENVFTKLGVETRMAAVRAANEKLELSS
jgi:DNA-binding CsgD family transcriptional regulator